MNREDPIQNSRGIIETGENTMGLSKGGRIWFPNDTSKLKHRTIVSRPNGVESNLSPILPSEHSTSARRENGNLDAWQTTTPHLSAEHEGPASCGRLGEVPFPEIAAVTGAHRLAQPRPYKARRVPTREKRERATDPRGNSPSSLLQVRQNESYRGASRGNRRLRDPNRSATARLHRSYR